jgi:uncharacterized protein YodC (DUF2158 family)
MSQNSFNVGDKVKLNSGGPIMTVTQTGEHEDGLVMCAWFNSSGKAQEQLFPPAALTKVDG